MPLAPTPLDTLNWGQIVTAIRSRIVADSANSWTLHAPVDPGVTMLELFAWLLDQRIYWMDQTPDALGLAILSLLGVSPKPAQAAVTLLQLSDRAVPPRSYPLAAARTLMRLADSNPPLLFTIDDDVVLLPVDTMGIAVGPVDHSDDLRQGHPIPLLSPEASTGQITITLNLDSPIPQPVFGEFCSLGMVLATSTGIIPAQWSAEAVSGVPAAATMSWSYSSSQTGTALAFPTAQVQDGTAGLRRSGIVRLPIPDDWQPEPPGAGATTVTYKLSLEITDAHFTFAPRLLSLNPNVVLAHHSWGRTKNLATTGWLPLPGNVISLTAAPSASSLKEYPPIEDTLALQITEPDKTVYPWQRVADLSLSGPTDRVFLLDRTRSEISFGDGLTGRLPTVDATNAAAVTVSYQAGGGSAGNVGQGRFWAAQPATEADPPPLFTAVNLTAGDGGADTESLDLAQQRSRMALNERNRAVAKPDYENLAMTTPGVGFRRAYAAVGYHPDFPCLAVSGAVTVFVVPYSPRPGIESDWGQDTFVAAPQPDPGALQATRDRMNTGRLLGADVFVCGPVYRRVSLAVAVTVDVAPSTALREAIIAGLQNYLDPLVGGDEGEGWPFGDPIRPTALMRVVQDILGTAGDVQSVSVRLDSATVAESCQDVRIRPHELLALAHVDLNAQRRRPEGGGLR
jgi:Baseplate J-like protein